MVDVNRPSPDIDREPPADEADTDTLDEQAALGAMMWGKAEPVIEHLASGDFRSVMHATLFAYLSAAWAAGAPTDPIAIAGRLRDAGELRRAGGLPYLHQIYAAGAAAADPVWHAKRVAAAAEARASHVLGIRISDIARNTAEPALRRQRIADLMAGWTTSLNGHAPNGHNNHPIDWAVLLETPPSPPDWLPGKLLCRGQQAALVGEGKAGKSLLAHEWAWRAGAGLPFLGDIARPPIRVLYLDQENTLDDMRSRMHSLGARPEQLVNLIYLSFPNLPPLDTAAGAGALGALADKHQPDLIFLDTISRMVEGPENDSPTWLNLYRHSLLPQKAAGRAVVRLDHFGKDTARGARGNSAKSQDVDQVWELAAGTGGLLQLVRSHTRTGAGEGAYTVRRLGEWTGAGWTRGATRHVLADEQHPLSVRIHQVLRELDNADVPMSAGRDACRKALIGSGLNISNEILSAAVRIRRAYRGESD